MSRYFNSRPCERGDKNAVITRIMFRFQFSPLREGRPHVRCIKAPHIDFNSRPCERGDRGGLSLIGEADISILAPARGATKMPFVYHMYIIISILAPARGAT